MYKLFLTFRYLTRKAIVIFPILVVWLCVMMLIIVTSIMGGFVERVQQANRQLLGDIVIDVNNRSGWPYYQELQQELDKLTDDHGQKIVLASTPVIRAYGLINLPDYRFNTFAQVIGIDPVGRAKVSSFRESLFRQYASPLQAVEDLVHFGLPAKTEDLQTKALSEFDLAQGQFNKALRKWLDSPRGTSLSDSLEDAKEQAEGQYHRAFRTWRFALQLTKAYTYQSRQELENALVPKEPTFDMPPAAALHYANQPDPPEDGCIVGVDIGMFRRDRRGNYLRPADVEFARAWLTVVPVSQRGTIVAQPASATFMVVDDSYTKVFDVDSTYVYAPFKKVQEMNNMSAMKGEGFDAPARCNELEIKVRGSDDPYDGPARVRAARDLIEGKLKEFAAAPAHLDLQVLKPTVQTWDQKQARYIGAVKNEKTMITFILLLMSGVVLVVIFLIFYMIVRDKTKDIGIIKALGGSEIGVGMIFTLYGLFIGVVGGILGMISGVAFVWHTNEIHELIYRVTGIMIWNRSVYLFDRIPDTVNPWEVALYVGLAALAGLVGALVPSIVAGAQNPVQAVRYE